MSFITDNHNAAKKYLEAFASCSPQEQSILRILSVIYKSITQTEFRKILSNLDKSKAFRGQKLTGIFTKEVRSKLEQKQLIEVTSKGIKALHEGCHSLILQCIDNGSFKEIHNQVNDVIFTKARYAWGHRDTIDKEREIRDFLYLGDFQTCEQLIGVSKNKQEVNIENSLCLVKFCFYPFEQDFFLKLSPDLQYHAITALFYYLRLHSIDNSEVIGLLQSLIDRGQCATVIQLILVEQYLWMGELDKAHTLLSSADISAYQLALSGWLAFLRGDTESAISNFEDSIVAKNKIKRRKGQYVGGLPGLFYLLALLKSGYEHEPSYLVRLLAEVRNYSIDQDNLQYELSCYQTIENLAQVFSGNEKKIETIDLSYNFYNEDFYFRLKLLLNALSIIWCRKKPTDKYLGKLKNYFKLSLKCNELWYCEVSAQILIKFGDEVDVYKKFLSSRKAQSTNLLKLVKRKEAWLQGLDQLIALQQPTPGPGKQQPEQKECRLIWLLNANEYPYRLEAREQKKGKRGWTKGRTVALKRLHQEWNEIDYLTAEDIKLCKAISTDYDYNYRSYWGKEYFFLSGYSALSACAGHPNLYLADNISKQVEVIEIDPELLITETGDGYKIHMPGLPKVISEDIECFSFRAETPNRYLLTNYNGRHLEIARIVGNKGLKVPKKAKEKVLETIRAIAPMLNIQSDIEGIAGVDTGIEQIEPDQHLYINIQPTGAGLQFECHVQPLGEEGPCLLPGVGNSMVVAKIEGKSLVTNRHLVQEKQQQEQLLSECPLFAYMSDHLLILDDLEDSLNCLEQLETLRTENGGLKIVLQWPKGQTIKLSRPVTQSQMHVSVSKLNEWFTLDGQLNIAEGEVLELKKLLTLIENSPGRFIPLKDNEFIALSDKLRQQLNDIADSTQKGKFHSLAAPLIEEATQGMKLKSNRAWQQQLKRLKESYSIELQLPPTLQAELRDYQKDGFDWACRLAHWGAGACLADDMGLGKTIQSLAVVLSRAADGPTLVLAPLSVCFNWQEEATRFAPTLNVKILGSHLKHQRQDVLDDVEAFDLIVCSYGLLHAEGERLSKVTWRTIIADEAQALKNPQTKRTRVAMGLNADFKMITTGTPIENNLGELWSLFRFINPGLLGSRELFNNKYANYIEGSGSNLKQRKDASQALRRLINPFILRRLKSEVLTELPPRTEINLHIELSNEEEVLYEAIRQKAVEKLAETEAKPGQKRIKILAEIMRLRRACCHPTLVMKDSGITGSKLIAFDELIAELKLGSHKALVFSQFVDHLKILREHLETKDVSFQYLDGSTSLVKRKKAVSAFQAGDGDLFLISLKAGGAGLNLTAADYVIHMDPWWNPAVEDQASDRAHRMGQARPVTIYRFITQNTIEDKIVALHQQKRDLANSLLEGTDSSSKMSYDDMMLLLQKE